MSNSTAIVSTCLPDDWRVFSLTYVPYPTQDGKLLGWTLALLTLTPIFTISSVFTITLVRQSVRWGLLFV
ncbi:Dolichyldiphosphatase 1, partial [Perkinsus olseni]